MRRVHFKSDDLWVSVRVQKGLCPIHVPSFLGCEALMVENFLYYY